VSASTHKEYTHGFLAPLTDEQVTEMTSDCRDKQEEAIFRVISPCPKCTSPLQGSSRSRQIIFACKDFVVPARGRKAVSVTASSNLGVNNVVERMFQVGPQERFLKIRVWSDHLEE
jgi:hypothetical protein